VYAARAFRRRGAGRVALETLIQQARQAGFSKLVSRIFVENIASRNLVRALGFREVGVYEKHGKLDGEWRDVVIVERLLI
jgi:L-amino acid N-acyltransferase YncA